MTEVLRWLRGVCACGCYDCRRGQHCSRTWRGCNK